MLSKHQRSAALSFHGASILRQL